LKPIPAAEFATAAPLRKRPFSPLLLDFAERGIVLAMTMLFFWRMAATIGEGNVINLLISVSEGLTAVFVLIRRPGQIATSPYVWVIAFGGTCGALLVMPGGAQLVPAAASVALMVGGLCLSISGKAFLSRSFGIVPANRGIQKGGPYGLVRHPIYLGYLLAHCGYLAANLSAWNVAVYAVTWGAQVLRIRAEERILSGDGAYREYKSEVRRRLIPGLW
jgi:protein-S-isoprenylcysteine O-methyltransferase Ste14